MNKIITTTNFDLYYGSFQALKSINIEIPEKEITALIGPSGCGKSTFLKTLNRMNDLVPGVKISGEIKFHGEDIFAKEMNVNILRKRIGMVFQKPNPFPMSIYDNIAYGPRLHGSPKKTELDEIVERSLRGSGFRVGSSSGSASRAPFRSSRKSCSWTNRPAPSIPAAQSGLKI